MQNNVFLLVAMLFAIACGDPNIETITVKDEGGILSEKYTQSKKNADKQGLYQKFFRNGKVKEEANYVANEREGLHKFFYENGTLEIEENYKAGSLHGMYKKYYLSGKINLEMNYANGVLTGLSKAWYENGQLKEEVLFAENEENGSFVEFYENGNLKAKGAYLDGPNEQDSLYIYDLSGQLERVMFCQKGVCNTAYGKKTNE
jgi:antitoxin component YwqK of YwqJK toxin-antitoxin module